MSGLPDIGSAAALYQGESRKPLTCLNPEAVRLPFSIRRLPGTSSVKDYPREGYRNKAAFILISMRHGHFDRTDGNANHKRTGQNHHKALYLSTMKTVEDSHECILLRE